MQSEKRKMTLFNELQTLDSISSVACVNTNRNFIGIELDKNYFNTAKERIEKISLEG